MILFKQIADLQLFLSNKAEIGFVPTMGALHQGHLSLLKRSKEENKLTICSIFINPKQFNHAQDFLKYPVTIDKDIRLLEEAGCDVLFLPDLKEIYPNDREKMPNIDFGFIGTTLEGAMRPGHFDGVAIVVERLLRIICPTKMYLGLKDYQQVLIIKKMVELRKIPIDIISCPTHREIDGLAMSSRNMRLIADQRIDAIQLSKVLFFMKEQFFKMPIHELMKVGTKFIENTKSIKLEYLEIRNADNLMLPHELVANNQGSYIILIAAYLGDVRLIDNLLIQANQN